VSKSGSNKWQISGMSSVHELPKEFKIDSEEELTSFGGLITKELGRIPEKGESLSLHNMNIKILEADETRIHLTEVGIIEENVKEST
jgi:magnesium and cobalt transporter